VPPGPIDESKKKWIQWYPPNHRDGGARDPGESMALNDILGNSVEITLIGPKFPSRYQKSITKAHQENYQNNCS